MVPFGSGRGARPPSGRISLLYAPLHRTTTASGRPLLADLRRFHAVVVDPQVELGVDGLQHLGVWRIERQHGSFPLQAPLIEPEEPEPAVRAVLEVGFGQTADADEHLALVDVVKLTGAVAGIHEYQVPTAPPDQGAPFRTPFGQDAARGDLPADDGIVHSVAAGEGYGEPLAVGAEGEGVELLRCVELVGAPQRARLVDADELEAGAVPGRERAAVRTRDDRFNFAREGRQAGRGARGE